MLNVACIGMYFCVYLYELVCIWYVLVCIHDHLAHRFGASTAGIGMYCVRICPYFGMYLRVFTWLYMCLVRICPY